MQNKPSTLKTIAWVYGVVVAFTVAYLVGPILIERQERKNRQ